MSPQSNTSAIEAAAPNLTDERGSRMSRAPQAPAATATSTPTSMPGPIPLGAKLRAFVYATLFNLKKAVDSPMMVVFSLGLPIFMYIMFGTGHSYVTEPVGSGNVSARILINMTTYGVIVAMSSMSVAIVMERQNGWIRQIALTPLGLGRWIATKVFASVILGVIIIAGCYAVGASVQAQMSTKAWITSAVAIVLCAALASPLAMAVAFSMRSEAAFSIVGGGSSIVAFASGMFTPLDSMGSTMQTVGQFMPFYGINRIPMAMLWGIDHTTWKDWTSVAVWLAISVTFATLASRNKVGR